MNQSLPNPWAHFGTVYICTLERSVDRQEWMKSEFSRLADMGYPVDYEFIIGEFKGTHLATTDSHMEIFEKVLKTPKSSVLIMEDDCEMLPEIVGFHDSLMDLMMHKDWEIFYLGAHLYGPTETAHGSHIRRVSKAVSLHSYALSRKGIEFLTSTEIRKELETKPLDLVICEEMLPRKNGYVANPMMTKQHPSFSDISGQFHNYDDMFETAKRWLK